MAARSLSGRVPLVVAVFSLALGLLWFSYARLVSEVYLDYSHRLASNGHTAQAQAAAISALGLAPWRPSVNRMRLAAHNTSASVEGSVQALRWSPSDPYLWAEYSGALIKQDRFDGSLAHALRSMNQLAPFSPTIQWFSASNGLIFWYRSTPEIRAVSMDSMRYFFKVAPKRYVRYLKKHHQLEHFCWTAGLQLGLEAWCDTRFPP